MITKLIDRIFDLILILFGLVALWILWQVFFFSSFHIPSDSMEPELKEGDAVAVFKPIIGARLFNINATLRVEETPIYRVPGWRKIKRNDVLVFNFPYPIQKDKIRMHILQYYIKRCIGLPGDSVSIRDGYFQVAGYEQPLGNLKEQQLMSTQKPTNFTKGVYNSFPYDSVMHWNIQDFGPLYLPKKGDRLPMTREHFVLYRNLIEWEQGKPLSYQDSTVCLDGEPITNYCFQKNYYFMAGDKSVNSKDSRYWGLLPEDYIVGKATFIWKSTDPYNGKIRWDRIFKIIH